MATTVGVVVFPGTNCEMDAVVAVERWVATAGCSGTPMTTSAGWTR